MGGYDISTCFHSFPFAAAPTPPPPKPPAPAPPVEVQITVNLVQVRSGAQSDAVRGLQILLNGRGGYGLSVDGIFGPKTDGAVRDFQHRHGLGVDGIAGTHTWGALLGVPQ